MKAKGITTTTRKLVEALWLPAWRWLASNTNLLCDRFAKAEATAHAEDGVSTRCGADLPASDQEAVAIMTKAINHGPNLLDLTRAAMSAARSVLPLTGQWKDEATAVIEAAEAWAANPNEENANAVAIAREALIARHGGNWGSGNVAANEEFSIMAAVAVALCCGFRFGVEALVVVAVESAGHAAGGEIDLAPLVTAALL
jgi:hypothetical protein